MGSYSTIHAKLRLRHEAPVEVKHIMGLIALCDSEPAEDYLAAHREALPHPYFLTDRWQYIFGNFTAAAFCHRTWDQATLTADCTGSVKNYDDLAQQFAEWIRPYLDPTFPSIVTAQSQDHDFGQEAPVVTYIADRA